MAEVWLGRRRGAGGVEKRVVIKRILRERVKDPRFLGLFVSEAQISMSLAHKNIVPMFDFGRVDDELFLVMEYIDGPSWASAMAAAKRKELPPHTSLVCHIMFEACLALDYAHCYRNDEGEEQRIAHRDVTPGNLLLSFTGDVKLGDFGLAAATAGVSKGEGSTRGTPGYMAPEQARGDLVGPPADIYSLGIILREALTLERVRSGTGDEQIAMASEPLDPLPGHIPEGLREICEKATRHDVAERFESAKQMAEELDTFLLQARSSNRADRRPMGTRLADWLQIILPEGLKTGKSTSAKLENSGVAVTYLDHGTNEVLDEPADATIRSMADTALENPGDTGEATVNLRGSSDIKSGQKADSSSNQEIALLDAERLEVRSREPGKGSFEPRPVGDLLRNHTRRDWALGGAALVLGGAALVYTYGGDESQPVATVDAALPLLQTETDAMPAIVHAQPNPDASLPDARASVRHVPIRQRKADAAPRTADSIMRVSTTPWATLKIVGRPETCDETPCQLRLPAGKYRVELANPVAGLKTTISVTLSADKPTRVHEVLRAAPR